MFSNFFFFVADSVVKLGSHCSNKTFSSTLICKAQVSRPLALRAYVRLSQKPLLEITQVSLLDSQLRRIIGFITSTAEENFEKVLLCFILFVFFQSAVVFMTTTKSCTTFSL